MDALEEAGQDAAAGALVLQVNVVEIAVDVADLNEDWRGIYIYLIFIYFVYKIIKFWLSIQYKVCPKKK